MYCFYLTAFYFSFDPACIFWCWEDGPWQQVWHQWQAAGVQRQGGEGKSLIEFRKGKHLIYLNNCVCWWFMKKTCRQCSPLFLQLALEYGIKFMETSAKANINVENVSRNSILNYKMVKRPYVSSHTICVFDLVHRHFWPSPETSNQKWTRNW